MCVGILPILLGLPLCIIAISKGGNMAIYGVIAFAFWLLLCRIAFRP